MKCLSCSIELVMNERGRPLKYCNIKCKSLFEYKKYLATRSIYKVKVCKGCKNQFHTLQSSRQQYCSKDCKPQKTYQPKDCSQCGKIDAVYSGRLYCESCIVVRRYKRRIHSAENAESNRKGKRLARERLAPGLGSHQRTKLLKLWKSERQPCSYCFNLADTIDHIVPLVRGGTNFENNLIPCCRACNSSKANKLISEWKVLNVRASTKTK